MNMRSIRPIAGALAASMAKVVAWGLLVPCLSAGNAMAQAPAANGSSNAPLASPPTAAAGSPYDYPTILRVEFVQECVNANGGAFVLMYQCACVLDKMREEYSADDFVEVTTFAKYATLAGERGGEFRDSDRSQALTRKFRTLQATAYKACGVVRQLR